MNLTTLEIDQDEAKARLAVYAAQIAEERTAEDDAIRAGYRAAARGLPVIQLSRVIEAGGTFDDGLPKIAVVRADATECWVGVNRWGRPGRTGYTFRDQPEGRDRGALVGAHHVRVSVNGDAPGRAHGGRTMVPIIPPNLRPRRSRLARLHILWEVEAWQPVPPVDPALIRYVRGDLWAVLATWDLTELERAVLTQRAHA